MRYVIESTVGNREYDDNMTTHVADHLPARTTAVAKPAAWKWLLLSGVVLAGLSFLASTLRSRPELKTNDRAYFFQNDEFKTTVAKLNEASRKEIESAKLQAAPTADTLTICRRISLALVGSSLSLEEVRAIEAMQDAERISWWTEHLLSIPAGRITSVNASLEQWLELIKVPSCCFAGVSSIYGWPNSWQRIDPMIKSCAR